MNLPHLITFLPLTLAIILSPRPCPAADNVTAELTIHITGVPSPNGHLRVSLCDSESGYAHDRGTHIGESLSAQKGKNTLTLEDIEPGIYAVKVFHDTNDNRKLDKSGFLKIPTESYGFSNNPPARFGPPSWHKAKFEIPPGKSEITIKLIVKD